MENMGKNIKIYKNDLSMTRIAYKLKADSTKYAQIVFKDEDPKEGDSISAQITSIDRKERFINLSVRALEKSEEKSLLKENIKKNKEIEESTKTSIGDLIKDEIGESSSDEDEKV